MIVIAGAGPGGLAAAAALHRAGFEILLAERADALRAAGAGLIAGANALRMLEVVGLAEAVKAAGNVIEAARVERFDGKCLSKANFSTFESRYGQPSVAIHRRALSETLAAALPDGATRFGAQVVDFRQNEAGVTVELDSGERLEAEALIGCDGIHSKVRTKILGPRTPRYAGYTAWRGIAKGVTALAQNTTIERWGPGRRFGIVPLGPDQTYFFATENTDPGGVDGEDPRAELQARFQDFAEPVGSVLAAVQPEAILRHDVSEIGPLPRWTEGRVTLLGDAAHAMTPNMGQGACQSIEDGVVLAACLYESRGDLLRGLQDYESRRRPRATEVAEKSRHLGELAQWKHPVARGLRDWLLSWMPPAVLLRGLDSTLGVPVPESFGPSLG